MNKKIKLLLEGTAIFISTLVIGFCVTAFSFNLFDALTRNQMRILFAVDIIVLMIAGSIAWGIFNSRKIRLQKEMKLQQRHNRRIENSSAKMKDIELIINENKFAA